MTYDDIVAMLEETGLPFAYDHFAEGESPDPPFIVFLLPRADDFFADDISYLPIDELHIELYTDKKDPPLEKKVEATLQDRGLSYSRSETWIPKERMYEVLYITDVIKEDEDAQEQS